MNNTPLYLGRFRRCITDFVRVIEAIREAIAHLPFGHALDIVFTPAEQSMHLLGLAAANRRNSLREERNGVARRHGGGRAVLLVRVVLAVVDAVAFRAEQDAQTVTALQFACVET